MVFKRCKGLSLEPEPPVKKIVVFLSPRFHTTQIGKSSSLVPRPYVGRVGENPRNEVARIRHRNALTAKAWEDAIQGQGKKSSK